MVCSKTHNNTLSPGSFFIYVVGCANRLSCPAKTSYINRAMLSQVLNQALEYVSSPYRKNDACIEYEYNRNHGTPGLYREFETKEELRYSNKINFQKTDINDAYIVVMTLQINSVVCSINFTTTSLV
jgi:hypothetical protein